MTRLALVAYDIPDSKRRRRVLRRIAPHRCDGQLSAHECWLSREDAHALLEDLSALLDFQQDRLIFTWVEPAAMPPSGQRSRSGPMLLT